MPTEDSATSFSRDLLPGLRPSVANIFNNTLVRPGVLADGAANSLQLAYEVVYRFIHLSSPGTATSQESFDLESHTANNDQVISAGEEPVGTLVTAVRGHNNSFTSEADPADSDQLAEARSPEEGPPSRPRRSWMWVAALIVIILFLIMLPGLILGLVTRQVTSGIAISGAFAPPVVFFGGLYYHHNR